MNETVLRSTAKALVAPGKGILAADQSPHSAAKLLDIAGVKSSPENRRFYREILFSTPGVEKFISGVILHDETFYQNAGNKVPFPKFLADRKIIPGTKVDKGMVDMPGFAGEKITEGIDGLRGRLVEYKKLGAKFAKWRAAFAVKGKLPSQVCVDSNSELLARYAATCQEVGLVPIVEPEVLMKGEHTIDEFAEDNKRVLKTVFLYLSKHKVDFSGMLLKPTWVHQGLGKKTKNDSIIVARYTLKVFREVVPDEVPGVVFLSGGDSPEDSTSHLDALNEINEVPWQLSFSFGRALQEPVLQAWQGKNKNIEKAQKVFYERARLNSLARSGEY